MSIEHGLQTVLNAHPDLHVVPHATSHLPKHVKWRSICSSKVEKSQHVVGSAKSLSAKLKHWADISLGHSLRSYHHTRPMKVKVVKWCRKKWNKPNLMYIYHNQSEIMQKNQWNSSNGQLHWFLIDFLWKWSIMDQNYANANASRPLAKIFKRYPDMPYESWRPGDSENVVVFYSIIF